MNWEAVSAIDQMVGAFAVVISLVYLASQIQSQRRDSRIAAVHELTDSFRAAIISFQDRQLAEGFSRAKSDFESLPEVERLQFISMVKGIFRVWKDAYFQYREKRLPDTIWKAMSTHFSAT
jgi:hypothetical protein